MENVLEVEGLTKIYPRFVLDGVSFAVPKGSVTGFIGRNGAGKSTTIKSMLGLVRPDGGAVRFFGKDISENERDIKGRVGYAGGAVDYYKRKKISVIVGVTKRFYEGWDDAAFEKYAKLFELDTEKTPSELSDGMRVKLNLTLALSHGAELLILDEPTSGLDPVSRDELCDVFRWLSEHGTSVFFSTHVTSDLEKCADRIVYIKGGRIADEGTLVSFVEKGKDAGFGSTLEEIMISREKEGFYEKLDR